VIGYAIDDGDPGTLYSYAYGDPAAERELLSRFYAAIDSAVSRDLSGGTRSTVKPVFVGHNVIDFDLRFLFQRSVMLGARPPSCIPFDAKPWDGSVFDTMTGWAGIRNRVSMDKLCKVFGFEEKDIFGLINQPIVVEYLEKLKTTRSSLVEYVANAEDIIYNMILTKYDPSSAKDSLNERQIEQLRDVSGEDLFKLMESGEKADAAIGENFITPDKNLQQLLLLDKFLKVYRNALEFIQFFGNQKNVDRLKSNLVIIPALFVFVNYEKKAFSISLMFIKWSIGFAISINE
jgi:hypothetical protein